MLYFCTYLDQHYLPRGLALYHSLKTHSPDFRLFVLCMDTASFETLTKLDIAEIQPISPYEFERGDQQLLAAKQNRSRIEYYFTCTPSLALFVLNSHPEVEMITYLDADLYFFSNPMYVYDEIGTASIAIIEHRFPPNMRHLEKTGVYNVGWLSFRRDQDAFACLDWWRERCLEWCYDRVENGRYADQKYLDDWPTRFEHVVVLQHKGANLAPWNLANYSLRLEEGGLYVDSQPLIFYHFHGLKMVQPWLYYPSWGGYQVRPTPLLRKQIYGAYLDTLEESSTLLQLMHSPTPASSKTRGHDSQAPITKRIVSRLRSEVTKFVDFFTGKYIVYVNRRVL